MKKLFTIIAMLANVGLSQCQTATILHHGQFNKNGKFAMSSRSYKPDDWEKPYFDNSIKTAFPSDLIKFPEKYKDKLIHLTGIADSVYAVTLDSLPVVYVLLDNKYWDYIEDYSIQDEVMFISGKGDGKFLVSLTGITPGQLESLKNFPKEKKLFFVYGNFKETMNSYPVITAQQIKFIDYEWYTEKIYSYEVKRDNDGNVETDKKGKVLMTNFHFFKIAGKGQNK
jgi:hypothetical protein